MGAYHGNCLHLQVSHKDEAFQTLARQTGGWHTMAPCMQIQILEEGAYVPNQISHSSGFRMSAASGGMGRSTMYAHVLKSQQPTESSKAKAVKAAKEKASYSVQVQPATLEQAA